jgi:hypothetical protein
MKVVLLSLAMIGSPMVIPVSDSVPKLDVEAMCKTTVATDKAMSVDLAQSYEDCMSDENAAQQQLTTIWLSNSGEVRNQCEGEATAGGSDSYVDLLTCLQMAGWVKPASPQPKLRGASKNRNKQIQ